MFCSQEYNICFTTVNRQPIKNGEGETILPDLPESNVSDGILPTQIKKLVDTRRVVKVNFVPVTSSLTE